MADTIRSLAELASLFDGTVLGSITAQDLRDLMVSQMVHGEIGSGASASVNIGTSVQAVQLTVAGEIGRGLTVDSANARMTGVPVDMKAIVHAEVLFRGTLNRDYEFSVWRNTHSTPQQIASLTRGPIRCLNAAQTISLAWSTSVQLQAGDSLQLGVRASAAASAFEMLFGVLRVQRIGVE